MTSLIEFEKVEFGWEEENLLFKDFSLKLSGGINSLVGQNGTGKSTLMLLASGRILPQKGKVHLLGQDTRSFTDEEQRNRLASFVYQNMEFETELSLIELFQQVLQSGNIASGGEDLRSELIEVLELEPLLGRKLQQLSKGEMQRALLVFALLYGSPVLFLDEPFFAMEEYQKEKALDYLSQYVKDSSIDIFISLHQMELSRKYSDNALLIHKNGTVEYGPTGSILQKDRVEEAFQVPEEMLYKKETLFREKLTKPLEGDIPGQVKVYD